MDLKLPCAKGGDNQNQHKGQPGHAKDAPQPVGIVHSFKSPDHPRGQKDEAHMKAQEEVFF